jgi:PEP-CTERM motif-containing protein
MGGMYNVARILGLGLAFGFAVGDVALADAFPDAISVPEPSSIGLFAMGAIGVIVARKVKQRK